MPTATKSGRPGRRIASRASAVSGSAAMEFLIFEDNGGGHRWAIVDGAGESLGQSGSFASHDEAEHAARLVRDNAGAARRERRGAADRPLDLAARGGAGSVDDSR